MKKDKAQTLSIETPERLTGIKVSKPKSKAAGVPGVKAAMNQMRMYMKAGDALKLSLKINQKDGFDCPGCAWPDPDDDRSALGEYCENGIKAIAEEATKKSIDADFFQRHSVQEMSQWTDFEIGKKGRLTQPMYVKQGQSHYEPISWDGAFQLIGKHLNELDSPDEAIFYTSGRTSNEAAYLYQLFVRAYGTNNLPDCSNMCHESSGVGLSETVGIGKGSVTLSDLHEAELIIVMGQNPGTNHPRMLSALEKCKKNGGKIITVNPLVEAGLKTFVDPQSVTSVLGNGTSLTDLYLQVKINGDIAFLKAAMSLLLKKEKEAPGTVFDHEFIKEYTSGYEEFIHELEEIDFEACMADCGLSKSRIEKAADLIARKERIIICWAMGLTQQENGVGNIKEVVNLLLLKGAIGKPGAGTCPVRGHSNVQGDRTMGIWEAPKEPFLQKLDEVHGIQSPRAHGFAVVTAIEAMKKDEGKVFFAMGGNFLSATPDTNYTGEALMNTKLTVHVSTKLNRSHLVHGKEALILPCLGRTDIDIQSGNPQFVTCENSMGVVQKSEGVLHPPAKSLKSEVRIVAEMALATLKESTIDWDGMSKNYDLIRNAIEQVIPGFDDYNARVRIPGGFYLPNGARNRKFNTSNGKANFSVVEKPNVQVAKDELVMMTMRSHDQYNTTIYGLDDRYRGIENERRVVLMNKEDIAERGLKPGSLVDLTSSFNGKERRVNKFVVVRYHIPKGNCGTYFPETNPLVPIDSFAKKSHTPTSKWVVIKVEPHKR